MSAKVIGTVALLLGKQGHNGVIHALTNSHPPRVLRVEMLE
jgi:hypothetical protein